MKEFHVYGLRILRIFTETYSHLIKIDPDVLKKNMILVLCLFNLDKWMFSNISLVFSRGFFLL